MLQVKIHAKIIHFSIFFFLKFMAVFQNISLKPYHRIMKTGVNMRWNLLSERKAYIHPHQELPIMQMSTKRKAVIITTGGQKEHS